MDEIEEGKNFGEFPRTLGLIVFVFSGMEDAIYKAVVHMEGLWPMHHEARIQELTRLPLTGKRSAIKLLLDLVRAHCDAETVKEYEVIHKEINELNRERGYLLHRHWMCYTPKFDHYVTVYKGKYENITYKFLNDKLMEVWPRIGKVQICLIRLNPTDPYHGFKNLRNRLPGIIMFGIIEIPVKFCLTCLDHLRSYFHI